MIWKRILAAICFWLGYMGLDVFARVSYTPSFPTGPIIGRRRTGVVLFT